MKKTLRILQRVLRIILTLSRTGEKRKLQLLRNFGSIEKIAKASREELKTIIGEKAANDVFENFEKPRKLAKK